MEDAVQDRSLDLVQETTVHRWEHPEQRRYYEASLQIDLWGGWTVLRVWGQIDSPRGSHLYEPIADVAAGDAALQRIARQRATRGYSPVRRAPGHRRDIHRDGGQP